MKGSRYGDIVPWNSLQQVWVLHTLPTGQPCVGIIFEKIGYAFYELDWNCAIEKRMEIFGLELKTI